MKRTRKGFTLVELLVVIAILAILATVSVVGYTSFINRANDSNAATELHQIQSYINADLMADNKWEYKLEDGTEVKVVKNSDGSLTVVQGATDLADAIAKCPDLQGLGSFAADPENERNLVYTASNGKGEAIWEGVVPPPCAHTNTETVTGTAATCTATGLTDGVKCKDCGVMVTAQTETAMIAHAFTNDECTACHAKRIYFVPGTAWEVDNARLVAYVWNKDDNSVEPKWLELTKENNSYQLVAPNGYTDVIFCRMNPNNSENRWNENTDTDETKPLWNQTIDLKVSDGKTYTLIDVWGAERDDKKATGAWDNETIIYLKPNSNWTTDNARFAAYFFDNGELWVNMYAPNNDGYYMCVAPAGYPKVIFTRMNPNAAANNWDNKWNQTGDLTVPTNGDNLYTINDGSWDAGSWSTK